MMEGLSLLDWLKAKLGQSRTQRYVRYGLALLAALWGLYLLRTGGALSGLFFLAVGLGLGAWGLSASGESVASVELPSFRLTPQVSVRSPGFALSAQWRWLALPGAFLLALAGQRSWYQAHQAGSAWPGLALLGPAAALFVWAVWREALDSRRPPLAPAAGAAARGEAEVRTRVVFAALALSVLTYFAVPNNNFTLPGRVLWIASLAAWLAAFWDGPVRFSFNWRGTLERFWRGDIPLRLSQSLVLLLGVLAVSAIFRFEKLDEVPKDMTSDHVEKLLDVNDILNHGKRPVFESANGGREPLEFYLAAITARFAGTGLTHLTLKLVTATAGLLTLPLVYLFAREIFDDDLTGLLAALVAGLGWWPNVISRNGLRFPFAPLFATLSLWLLIRGIKRNHRNSVLLAGLALGIGLYGYTPVRVVPVAVVVALGLYALHRWRQSAALKSVEWLVMFSLVALAAFVPLFRYAQDEPEYFWERTLTRLTGDRGSETRPTAHIFIHNEWNSLRMFSWTYDTAWLVSPPSQPALDWVMGGLFLLGAVFLLYRYLRWRHWLDLFLLVAIPVLLLPSTLSLAFPEENPSLHRSGAAIPAVFTLVGLALRLLIEHSRRLIPGRAGTATGVGLAGILLAVSAQLNARILLVDYARNYAGSSQNASEVGAVVRGFAHSIGSYETAFVRAYPNWVDTRAVGIYAGQFGWDQAILTPEDFQKMKDDPRPLLFILHRFDIQKRPDGQPPSLPLLRQTYPEGRLSVYHSLVPDHDFLLYFVPGTQDVDENTLPAPPP